MPRRTRADWQSIIEQQLQSGLSIVEFCKQKKINTKSFYRSRLILSKQQQPDKFLPVLVPTVPAQKIVLELDNAKLHIPPSCEPMWLAQLLKAVQG